MATYMTKHTANRSDITLPLLIKYVDAPLPSLTTQANTTIDEVDNLAKLLWVVLDKDTHLAIKSQLKSHMASKDHNTTIRDSQIVHVTTLSELNQQQIPERYALACFWLPTLSPEMLQQYIPLLMRYRDLYAAHLLIALNNTIDLKPYGFTPFNILNEQSLEVDGIEQTDLPVSSLSSVSATLWQFNLYDYKKLPNWLNADYWANPENWGKNRW